MAKNSPRKRPRITEISAEEAAHAQAIKEAKENALVIFLLEEISKLQKKINSNTDEDSNNGTKEELAELEQELATLAPKLIQAREALKEAGRERITKGISRFIQRVRRDVAKAIIEHEISDGINKAGEVYDSERASFVYFARIGIKWRLMDIIDKENGITRTLKIIRRRCYRIRLVRKKITEKIKKEPSYQEIAIILNDIEEYRVSSGKKFLESLKILIEAKGDRLKNYLAEKATKDLSICEIEKISDKVEYKDISVEGEKKKIMVWSGARVYYYVTKEKLLESKSLESLEIKGREGEYKPFLEMREARTLGGDPGYIDAQAELEKSEDKITIENLLRDANLTPAEQAAILAFVEEDKRPNSKEVKSALAKIKKSMAINPQLAAQLRAIL